MTNETTNEKIIKTLKSLFPYSNIQKMERDDKEKTSVGMEFETEEELNKYMKGK